MKYYISETHLVGEKGNNFNDSLVRTLFTDSHSSPDHPNQRNEAKSNKGR